MKVLLIEDDQHLLNNTKTQCIKAGFGVDTAESAEQALTSIDVNEYDCIILDINLPDGDGFDICEKVRKQENTTPIIIMTARDAVSDKIKGLELGADDYVLKPVDSQELIARIKALIRRNSKKPLPILKIADLEIDTQSRRVSRKNQIIELPTKEYTVLELLARHSDEVVTRSMLMEHIWGSDFETFSNVVDVYIKNLRKKIDSDHNKKLIHTIRGGGYSLSDKR
jgi:two-component system, OmpR family, copper resistance phosphate regulon response regulator CusR